MMDTFFAYINHTQLLGIIPLDSFLHFFLGAIISIIGLKYNYRLLYIFFFLLIIVIIKELNDYHFAYKTQYFAYLSDILASLIYIPLIAVIRKIKNYLTLKEKNTLNKLKY